MNKLSYASKASNLDIILPNKKIIIGNNYNKLHKLYNKFRSYMYGCPDSEFCEENNLQDALYYDDKPIINKGTDFYEITPSFRLSEDLKLSTKSLSLKYLEIKLKEELLFDTLSTVNVILNSLAQEVNDLNDVIHISFKDFNYKLALKILEATSVLDGISANEKDYSFEEIIILQLKLISEIVEKSNNKIIVFCELPYINETIFYSANYSPKANYIFYTNHLSFMPNLEELFILDEELIDLADEQQIYEKFLNEKYCVSELQEVKNMLIKDIKQYIKEKTGSILSIFKLK